MRRLTLAITALTLLAGTAWAAPQPPLTPEQQAQKAEQEAKRLADELIKVEAVMPDKPAAQPAKPRKLLVFTLTKGFHHDSIPLAAKTFEMMGKKTGAWETTISDDPQVFAPEKLKEFDAVLMDSTTGTLFNDAALKQSLLDFVKGGKGIAGIHAATDCFYQWPEYGDLFGGYFMGHPFSKISVKVDDPNSPINAAFAGQGFDITDEIYTFKTPYSREKLRILISVDWDKSDKAREAAAKAAEAGRWKARADNDYALSWIKEYGQGRVFYCAFGHQHPIFWNAAVLKHYLAGIQYALGDLKADAAPSVKPAQ